MKKFVYLFVLLSVGWIGCNGSKSVIDEQRPADITHYLKEIKRPHLEAYLNVLAADDMEGRKTGEAGQKKVAAYIRDFYKKNKIAPAEGTQDYYQAVSGAFMQRQFSPKLNDSENVVAVVEGSDLSEEYLVISAHYDHVGMANGQIFNGADDNGSGTSGLMELARVFQKAKNEGNGPRRTIVFLHCTGEEYGLHGSRYYTDSQALYPLNQTIANLNIDMIGRVDAKHQNSGNYIYLVGSDRLSLDLHNISEEANANYVNIELDYEYNALSHPEMIYYRSDHYNFAKNNIPVIFYYNGSHPDYHMPTDTVEKIDFDQMLKRVQLVFATAWELANRDEKPKLK